MCPFLDVFWIWSRMWSRFQEIRDLRDFLWFLTNFQHFQIRYVWNSKYTLILDLIRIAHAYLYCFRDFQHKYIVLWYSGNIRPCARTLDIIWIWSRMWSRFHQIQDLRAFSWFLTNFLHFQVRWVKFQIYTSSGFLFFSSASYH